MNVFDFFFHDSPKITKILTLTCIFVSVITWFDILNPLQIYINYDLIIRKLQVDFV